MEGQDKQSLLFNFLDELLFVFSTELLVCKSVKVTGLDRQAWTINAEGYASITGQATTQYA